MLPLFRDAFRIDVRVPNHRSRDEWVLHAAGGKRNVADAFVAKISLADVEAVAPLREWTTARFVADGHVGRTRVRARLETYAEEPVVRKRAAQAESQAITGTIPLRVF